MSVGGHDTVAPGDPAPNFTAPSTLGDVEFHRWKGRSWALLLAYPDESSPVLFTELLALARLREHFVQRDAKVICVSGDPVAAQLRRRAELEALAGVGVEFPLIGDSAGAVAAKYGIRASGSALRTMLVVDPAHRVRLAIRYPDSVGAGFEEILRLLDALRLVDRHRVHTPAEWRPGGPVIVAPELDDETAFERYGHFDAQVDGLRTMADPGPPAAGA
jgi:alkyl hydroperoxide reductase subunit AhpC